MPKVHAIRDPSRRSSCALSRGPPDASELVATSVVHASRGCSCDGIAPFRSTRSPSERVARPDATLALDPAAEPSIIEQHHLDLATWRALRQHWQGTLRAALRDGDPMPLRAYDDAYVVELERVRGAITPEQHASLTRASERGASAEGLATLGLPVAAVLALERALLRRRAD